MFKRFLLGVSFFIAAEQCHAQVDYNANTKVNSYNNPFSFGVNVGYWGRDWIGKTSDITLGNALLNQPGIGATGIRYTLNNDFLETWTYDIYLKDYKVDQTRGALDNVLFLEKPAKNNRTISKYCEGKDTLMFKDIYLPIWDNNEGGTPINDSNPYALYVYKTVTRYKDYIKFWEIWNEPDFTISDYGWQDASYANSWFNKDPDPCDLTNILSPIYSYNRLLRISYEVIKYVDPTAFITTGGIGYPGFLTAMLRNTDNPDHGKVSSEYPLKAGAYFDVLSFHDYPQFAVGESRHSDGAVKAMINHKNEFQEVLNEYGYDGKQFPLKHFILTEVNVARKSINGDFGGEQAQINFLLKAPVLLQANGVKQMYIYALSEVKPEAEAKNTFDLMGLYENLSIVKPYHQIPTTGGIAFKTISNSIYNAAYDLERTNEMNLPDNIGGGAFRRKDGKFIYVIWAKTTTKNSEEANAVYTFPEPFRIKTLEKRNWDYSQTGAVNSISAIEINLTGTPVILIENELLSTDAWVEIGGLFFDIYPNPAQQEITVTYELQVPSPVTVSLYDVHGRLIQILEQKRDQSAGIHSINFSPTNLPGGIYHCLLGDGHGIRPRQLVVIK